MVECHLAKVKVAGSSPVSRSKREGTSSLHKISDDDRSLAYSSQDMRP